MDDFLKLYYNLHIITEYFYLGFSQNVYQCQYIVTLPGDIMLFRGFLLPLDSVVGFVTGSNSRLGL